MFRSIAAAALTVLAGSAPGFAQDCSAPSNAGTMQEIEEYFAENPVALFNTQLQFNAIAGRTDLTPDGIWGPNTSQKVCGSLLTYVTINGFPADQLFTAPDDVAYFVTWMGSWARSKLNPGLLEAPD